MTRVTGPSWEELNAYVDGELDKARAAEIADAAAGDRRLAGAIAQLMKAKSGVAAAGFATAPESLADFVKKRERNSGWRALRRPALAASFALALLGAGLLAATQERAGDGPDWLREAKAIHAGFTSHDSEPLRVLPATAFALEGRFVLLPDLAAGELTLVAFETLTDGKGALEGVAAHYRGNRGCQITLIALPVAPGAIQAETPQSAEIGDGDILAWRDGEAGYLLLSSGMDAARFQLLAEKIQTAAKELRLFTPDEELALAESRAASQPCSA